MHVVKAAIAVVVLGASAGAYIGLLERESTSRTPTRPNWEPTSRTRHTSTRTYRDPDSQPTFDVVGPFGRVRLHRMDTHTKFETSSFAGNWTPTDGAWGAEFTSGSVRHIVLICEPFGSPGENWTVRHWAGRQLTEWRHSDGGFRRGTWPAVNNGTAVVIVSDGPPAAIIDPIELEAAP